MNSSTYGLLCPGRQYNVSVIRNFWCAEVLVSEYLLIPLLYPRDLIQILAMKVLYKLQNNSLAIDIGISRTQSRVRRSDRSHVWAFCPTEIESDCEYTRLCIYTIFFNCFHIMILPNYFLPYLFTNDLSNIWTLELSTILNSYTVYYHHIPFWSSDRYPNVIANLSPSAATDVTPALANNRLIRIAVRYRCQNPRIYIELSCGNEGDIVYTVCSSLVCNLRIYSRASLYCFSMRVERQFAQWRFLPNACKERHGHIQTNGNYSPATPSALPHTTKTVLTGNSQENVHK